MMSSDTGGQRKLAKATGTSLRRLTCMIIIPLNTDAPIYLLGRWMTLVLIAANAVTFF